MGIFLLWASWAHEYMVIFLSKLMGITRRGVLKYLDIRDSDQIWSACQ